MSEESAAEAAGVSGPDTNGLALDLAMEEARADTSHRAKVDAFFDRQIALTALQEHHLHAQFPLLLRQLRLGVSEKRLGVLLRLATAFVGFAVAAGLAFLVWNAARSSTLRIEPFSVPPDLASRGMTGEVVAARLLDRLVDLQAQTSSLRAPRSFTNSWDEKGIKLDIPETGVSLAELDSFLRERLGDDTHVSGEVVRGASGVSLTVRAGANGSAEVRGPEADLDALVQQLSESVYRLTQPYRYGVYLASHDRNAEAIPILQALTRGGSKEDRTWAFIAWGLISEDQLGFAVERGLLTKAIDLDPRNILALSTRSRGEELLGQLERALSDLTKQRLMYSQGQSMVRDEYAPILQGFALGRIAALTGDFQEAIRQFEPGAVKDIPGRLTMTGFLVRFHLGQHDLAEARTALANVITDSPLSPGSHDLSLVLARMRIAAAAQDWAGVLAGAEGYAAVKQKYPGQQFFWTTAGVPLIADAQARLGNMAAAEVLIRATPEDCYGCVLERAHLAEMRGEQAQADAWFDRAARSSASIPMAESEWGQALLARGKPDAAIEKFKLASQKGPKFADPLEGWGEALMAKNQSHLALAKFTEAEKYTPNWGRLHLKWGEALAYAGKQEQAKAEFARAATLDLTPAEKSELSRRT